MYSFTWILYKDTGYPSDANSFNLIDLYIENELKIQNVSYKIHPDIKIIADIIINDDDNLYKYIHNIIDFNQYGYKTDSIYKNK